MQWTSEIYHFEATPPPGSWERISFELDNDISAIRQNLKDIEETPPPQVWASVIVELNGTKTKEIRPWYMQPSRWAAAAAITGIAMFSLYLVNSPKSFTPADIATSLLPSESSAINPTKKIPAEISITPPATATTVTKSAKIPGNTLPQEELEEVSVTAYRSIGHKPLPIYYAQINTEIEPGEIQTPRNIHDNRDYRLMKSVQFHDGNYIQIIGAEGNTTRVSYKLQELIPAIRNDIDNPTLTQWRSKLQSSVFVPASVNFFDIADMLTLFSEQQ
jgi:hypothetical protein